MFSKLFSKILVKETRNLSKKCFSEERFCPGSLSGKLGILGVPFGKGQKKKGKEEIGLQIAPDFIRKTGFSEFLNASGMDVIDYGNVEYQPDSSFCQPNMHNLDHFIPCVMEVSRSVERILADSRSCLVLGGDHSIAVGSVHAHMRVADPSRVALIWIDAHTDINTSSSSPSGNLHGMPVALLAHELQYLWSQSNVPGLEWLTPGLPLKNVAYIGTRSVDSGEIGYLTSNDVTVFSMEDLDELGYQKVLRKALAAVDPGRNKSIHVSFDIDALDYLEAPCTTVPGTAFGFCKRGGLTLREALGIAELLNNTRRVSVVDLVEVNPAVGNDIQRELTLQAVKKILLALYGDPRGKASKRVRK